jgi:predicted RNA-binding Zn-ribbon protein involved in translation (DUF1610 family)
MEMKCPQCDFDGEFKKGETPFFVFGLIDSYIAAKKAKNTFICPKCGCEVRIKRPTPTSTFDTILCIIIALLIVATFMTLKYMGFFV